MAHVRHESTGGSGKYTAIASSTETAFRDDESDHDIEGLHNVGEEGHSIAPSSKFPSTKASRMPFSKLQLTALILVCAAIVTFASGVISPSRRSTEAVATAEEHIIQPGDIVNGKCIQPALRKEWRTLSLEQKDEYINAVLCLTTKPSKLGHNGTLYDDFPWVHGWVGMISHQSAGFSSWHRYFLHIYEQTLRNECGYTGYLTYWDWSLDWQDLRKSPIWDTEHGFGSDGEAASVPGVSGGFCVNEGPFKNLQPYYHIGSEQPHCLSRGLSKDDEQVRQAGTIVSPDALEAILQTPDFVGFVPKLEKNTHDAIHNVVKGDFMEATAPNDPLFYLHHVQLDRMWWLWQQRDLDHRLVEYTGNNSAHSGIPASLYDVLPVSGLAEPVTVRNIMSTEGSVLCYSLFGHSFGVEDMESFAKPAHLV